MMRGLRRSVLTVLAPLALCACTQSTAPETGATSPVNNAVLADLQAKGVPAEIALFFAGTKIQSQCPNDTTCIYLQTFPNGAAREITLHVLPDRQYTPTSDEIANATGRLPVYGFKYAANFQADPVTIDLNYYVAKEGLPKVPSKKGQAFLNYAEVPLLAASLQAGAGGGGVSWTETGKKAADATIGGVIDAATAKGINLGPLGSIYSLASALSDVSSAMELGKQVRKSLRELDELEKCAANPTNPVSRSDPNYSRDTVKMIRKLHSEMQEVGSVRFLNQMTEKLADLTPVTAVMAVGLKHGFAWSEQTLGDYSENTIMREARLAVVKCDDPPDLDGNLKYEAECTLTNGNGTTDHTVTRFVGNVSWEWQMGVKYLPKGTYTYSSVRTVGPCTGTTTAQGSLTGTGYLFVFDDPVQQKEQGYGYEARFNQIPAVMTVTWSGPSSCGIPATLMGDVPFVDEIMHGFQGAGGSIAGSLPGKSCQPGQPSKFTWNFSIPPPKK